VSLQYCTSYGVAWGRVSAVGIAIRYRRDGPVIESRWGRDTPHPSRPTLGSTQPPIQWVPGLSRGLIGGGVALTTNPQCNAEVEEIVELYLCSPSGLSWPVLGWTLPLPLPSTRNNIPFLYGKDERFWGLLVNNCLPSNFSSSPAPNFIKSVELYRRWTIRADRRTEK